MGWVDGRILPPNMCMLGPRGPSVPEWRQGGLKIRLALGYTWQLGRGYFHLWAAPGWQPHSWSHARWAATLGTQPHPPDLWNWQVGVKGSRPQAREGPTAADAGSLAAKPGGLQRPLAGLPVQLAPLYTQSLVSTTSHSWAHLPRPGHMVWVSAAQGEGRAPGRAPRGGSSWGAGGGQAPTLHRDFHPRLFGPMLHRPSCYPTLPTGSERSWPAGSRGLSFTRALGGSRSLLLSAESAPGLRREDVPIHSGVQPTRGHTAIQWASGHHSSLSLPEAL